MEARGAGAKLGRTSRFEIQVRELRTARFRKPLKMRGASGARARNLRPSACTSGGVGRVPTRSAPSGEWGRKGPKHWMERVVPTCL
jgi:hypothetical protein